MNIALIGFGVVGQAFVKLLHDTQASLAQHHAFSPRLLAVTSPSRGALYHPEGLDLAALLSLSKDFSAYPDSAGLERGLSTTELIKRPDIDAIVEVSPTDLDAGGAGLAHCRLALRSGKHVVTANKGPIAVAYSILKSQADEHGVQLRFEATVMSGTPAVQLGFESLRGAGIQRIRGIFNGTTNYILSQMESGQPYAAALATAQQKGYAETDPTADVEGHDTLAKVLILANTLMGGKLRRADVPCMGITTLNQSDISAATAQGEHWKLIGSISRTEDGIKAEVGPQRLPAIDPLAGVSGAYNAITFETDLLGDVTLIGPGAGGRETAYALLSDLMAIQRGK